MEASSLMSPKQPPVAVIRVASQTVTGVGTPEVYSRIVMEGLLKAVAERIKEKRSAPPHVPEEVFPLVV